MRSRMEYSSSALPILYMVAMVPTKTSRAAKEVIRAIPIFQSKPRGSMAGSINLPSWPAKEASILRAAMRLSVSCLSNWRSTAKASASNRAACISARGPKLAKAHSTTDIAMMMRPASTTKERTFSHTVRNTLRMTGLRYSGNSSIRKLRSFVLRISLKIQADNKAAMMPSKYKPMKAKPCRLKMPPTTVEGTTKPMSTV